MKNLNNKKNIANAEVYHQDFEIINERRMENDSQNTNWDGILELHRDDLDKSCEFFLGH